MISEIQNYYSFDGEKYIMTGSRAGTSASGRLITRRTSQCLSRFRRTTTLASLGLCFKNHEAGSNSPSCTIRRCQRRSKANYDQEIWSRRRRRRRRVRALLSSTMIIIWRFTVVEVVVVRRKRRSTSSRITRPQRWREAAGG